MTFATQALFTAIRENDVNFLLNDIDVNVLGYYDYFLSSDATPSNALEGRAMSKANFGSALGLAIHLSISVTNERRYITMVRLLIDKGAHIKAHIAPLVILVSTSLSITERGGSVNENANIILQLLLSKASKEDLAYAKKQILRDHNIPLGALKVLE